MRKINIYYNNNNVNPFVRMIVRATYMLNDTKVFFVRSNIINTHKNLLSGLSRFSDVADIISDKTIMARLGKKAKSKDLKNCLLSVFSYVFGKSKCEYNVYVDKWIDYYGENKQFEVIEGKSVINNTNLNETKTYIELFEIQRKNTGKIDNAVFTLLHTIPCDVDQIVDIGSGPGFVNVHIPPYYHVLAVDIDQDILNQNKCEKCIGDILDLPIKSKSVDMAISCDVLEHIESDKIETAIREMKRIATKYFYVQVPNEEILRYSFAKCPECGNVWHVNHHKNSFTLNDFKKYSDDEWQIERINYTGFVDNQKDNPSIYREIEDKNIDMYRVKDFTCPKCKAKSETYNIEWLKEREKEDNLSWRSQEVSPKYTEIGVLFSCKNSPRISYEVTNVESYVLKRNEVDFSKKFRISENYTGKEQIPFVIGRREDKEVINIIDRKNYMTCVFPYDLYGSEILIEGEIVQPGELSVYSVLDEEEMIYKCNMEEKRTIFKCKCNNKANYIRLYTSGVIVINKVSIEGGVNNCLTNYYEYIVSPGNGEITFKDKNMFYFVNEEGIGFEYSQRR